MIRHYLQIALRSFRKYKLFALINILGITLGMSAFILILKYVNNELGYDQMHSKKDRIFRVQLDRYNQGELTTQWAAGCAGIGPAMIETFPEVKTMVKMHSSNAMVSYDDKVFREHNFYYASEDFFRIFDFSLIQGIDSLALKEPYSAVLSESTAKKYFGDEDPMGKILTLNGSLSFKITGIYKDVPENSHMKFDGLFSFETYVSLTSPEARTSFQWDGFYTYVLLDEKADAEFIESKLPGLVNQYAGASLEEYGEGMVFHLQKLGDIHLNSDYMMEFEVNGDQKIVYFLSVIAFLILIIAWVNYINMSASLSMTRMKEIGIRKVMGSFKSQLIFQFLTESFMVNAVGIILSVGAAYFFLPQLNDVAGRNLRLFNGSDLTLWGIIALVFIGGGIISGLYPAFILARLKPVNVLKARSVKSPSGNLLRRALVVFQFAVSIILIIGTSIVYRQIQFLRSQNLGVSIDHTMVLVGPNVTDSTYNLKRQSFKNEAMRLPYISSVAGSTTVPGTQPPWNAGGIRKLGEGPEKGQQYRVIGMDEGYIEHFGLSIIEGRKFSEDFPHETESVLFNESAIELMGFESMEEAINQKIMFWGDTFSIVGVVKDYHHESLKRTVEPLIFRYFPNIFNYISIKVQAGHYQEAVAKMGELFSEFFPGNEYDYFFLDDHFNQQYHSEVLFGRIFGTFSVLAIVIACLGLFGLTGFEISQRTREIGIRKALGATRQEIVVLLSGQFSKLILIAGIFAIPLVWWLSRKWLENFANQVTVAWWVFIIPGALVLLLAILTVSYHTLRISGINPTETLRVE